MTGEAIIAFATLTESNAEEEGELIKELRMLVRGEIGPFASPDIIVITPSLPMVRSICFSSYLYLYSDVIGQYISYSFFILINNIKYHADEERQNHATSTS